MKLFKDVRVGEIFFENETGEYYKKLADDTSVMWELAEDRAHLYRHHPSMEFQTMEFEFPQDHMVEEPES
jgi:hypothetical protein